MKKVKILSITLTLVLLTCISVISFRAGALYVEGPYTFEEIDGDYVSLYGYDNSSETLVIPAMYNNSYYVSDISEYAFDGNTTITSIDFSKNNRLSNIGMKSFNACTNLSGALVLPRSVRNLGLGAFERCTSLTELEFNSSAKTIPQQCFNRCSSLSTVNLSPSVERIENLAFANCELLSDVYFTASVNYISDTAFQNSGNVCFHVFYDSYAHHFAMDNNIQYVLIDKHNVVGDVNDDGVIDVFDANEIQKYAAEKTDFDDDTFYRADVNHDDYVNVIDALVIQKYVVGNYEIS